MEDPANDFYRNVAEEITTEIVDQVIQRVTDNSLDVTLNDEVLIEGSTGNFSESK